MINNFTDSETEIIAMKPAAAEKFFFLEKRIAKLENKYTILKKIIKNI
jgi:hypothetical protein